MTPEGRLSRAVAVATCKAATKTAVAVTCESSQIYEQSESLSSRAWPEYFICRVPKIAIYELLDEWPAHLVNGARKGHRVLFDTATDCGRPPGRSRQSRPMKPPSDGRPDFSDAGSSSVRWRTRRIETVRRGRAPDHRLPRRSG